MPQHDREWMVQALNQKFQMARILNTLCSGSSMHYLLVTEVFLQSCKDGAEYPVHSNTVTDFW